MIKICIDKIDYKVPNSYDDISIKMFQNIFEIQNFKINENEKNKLMIATLLNIDVNLLNNLTIKQIEDILNVLQYIKNEVTINDVEFITIDNVKYYQIKDFNQLEYGAFIDLDILISDNIINNIHKIISIIYRRKIDGKLAIYDSNESNRISEYILNNINISYIYQSLLFFCRIENKFTQVIQVYLTVIMMMMKVKKLNNWSKIKIKSYNLLKKVGMVQ